MRRRRTNEERFDIHRVSGAYVRAWVMWALPIAIGLLVFFLALGWFLFTSDLRTTAIAEEESELQAVVSEIETKRQASGETEDTVGLSENVTTTVDADRVSTDKSRGEAFLQAAYTWAGSDGRASAKATLARDWKVTEGGSNGKYPPSLSGNVEDNPSISSKLGGVESFLTSTQGSWYIYWSMVDIDTHQGRQQQVVTWKTDGSQLMPLSFSTLASN